MPKISVLMSAYNAEKHLAQAIESVVDDGFKDYELIIANDGSTDSTASILSFYQQKFQEIKVISKDNTGLTHSLNVCLSHASGDYVARLDADDLTIAGRLAAQSRFLDNHKDVSLIGTNAILINEKGTRIGKSDFGALSHQECVARLETMASFFAHSTWMVRREIMLELGGYDEFFRKAQDYEFLLRCIEKYRICCLPDFYIALRKINSTVSYDPEFLQYKFAVTARVLYALRAAPTCDVTIGKDKLWAAVNTWFADLQLSRKMLAQRYLSFAIYDLKAGLLSRVVKQTNNAFKSDPLFILNRPKLARIRENPLKTFLPYLDGAKKIH